MKMAEKEPMFPAPVRPVRAGTFHGFRSQRAAGTRSFHGQTHPCEVGRGSQGSCCRSEQHSRHRGAPSESQSREQSAPADGRTLPCVEPYAHPTSNSSVFHGKLFPSCGCEFGQPCRPIDHGPPLTGIGSKRSDSLGRRCKVRCMEP